MPSNFNRSKFAHLLRMSLQYGTNQVPGSMSQADLARLLGVDQQTVSRWARSENKPNRSAVDKMAVIFGWTEADLDTVYGRTARSRIVAEDPMVFWRTINELPPDFPRLDPVDPALERQITIPEQRRIDLERIRTSTKGYVRFPVGHGATTAARLVVAQLSEIAVQGRFLPILLTLEDLAESSYSEMVSREAKLLRDNFPEIGRRRFTPSSHQIQTARNAAEEECEMQFGVFSDRAMGLIIRNIIRHAVVTSFVTRAWNVEPDMPEYEQLLGADLHITDDLAARLALLQRLLPTSVHDGFKSLEAQAPALARGHLSNILTTVPRLRLRLFVDLSPTPAGRIYLGREQGEYLTLAYRRMTRLVGETVRCILDEDPALASLADISYFVPAPLKEIGLLPVPQGDQREIDMTGFSYADAWELLADRAGARREDLLAALGSDIRPAESDFLEHSALSTGMVWLSERLPHLLSTELTGHAPLRFHSAARG